MVPLPSLWMPIVVSAVIVFLASFIMHMVLTYHRSDWRGVPEEAAVMNALRPFNIPPGDYMLPHGGGPEAMKDAAFLDKMKAGPVVIMTVLPNGLPSMRQSLVLWFLFSILVGVFVAYLTGRALAPGADYREVFRFAGTIAFVGYSLALLEFSIWYKRAWKTTFKSVFDGLVYGLLTAGAFGWLWPR